MENVFIESPTGLRVVSVRSITLKNVKIKAAKGSAWMVERSAEHPR